MLLRSLVSLMAAAAACGCTTYDARHAAPNPVVQTPAGTYALGTGVVESVSLQPAPLIGERASASTGGSVAPHAAYRLAVRMQDGSLQVIDQPSNDFQVGDRVRVTGSGRVIRP
ncbi:MAG TPA: hypothetical protein VHL85_05125 [Burkholderiales bacterium]|jgi:hypothetical protein|nr:hypothetical protein [Burkholderiales bacterium]